MSIQARYSGTCRECGGRWEPGDLIRTVDEHDLGADLRQWRHAVCPDQPSDYEHHNPVCTTCWLSHPEGACDR